MNVLSVFNRKKKIPAPWEKYYTKDELNIKIPNCSMYDHVKRSSIKHPDAVAIEYFSRRFTYTDIIGIIDEYAVSFHNYGIKKGDIVTICLPNIPESLFALYALNKIGAIANMTHPLSSEEEIVHAVNSTSSEMLIMFDTFYDKVENVVDKLCAKKIIYASAGNYMKKLMGTVYKISQHKKTKLIPKNDIFISWADFKKKYYSSEEIVFEKNGRDDTAVIIHSGGTSGKAKNVLIQNRAFYLGAIQTGKIDLHLKPGDCCLAIMPNFHGFGLSVCMHTPLLLGCYTILVPTFDAKKFDILFKKTRPTVVLGVPTLFEALISNNNVKNLDLSFLKYLICGGDLLSANLENRVNEYLKSHNSKAKITQGYGLSEALAAVTLAHDDVNKSGSIGIPLAGNYVKIIDTATRKTVEYGEVGEICIHTRGFMSGYLNDESETSTALQYHDDGHIWLHTGDLGCMDEDGFVFYKGRIKRMIISSGYNIYPSHIEEVIESHPAVLQCSVVGVPHPYKQEVPKAFIVLKDGYTTVFTKRDIKEYCKKKLAKYMIPSEFVFRKKLPKTKLGKIDFRKLQNDFGKDDE